MSKWTLTVAGVSLLFAMTASRIVVTQGFSEAPAGFNNSTNGMLSQADFDAVRETFEERDSVADGLGPVYNAQSCAECHQSPVTGGVSQVDEMRAGRLDGFGRFVDHPGGSLIHSRATDAAIQEHVKNGYDIVTLRSSINTLGDGYVEAVSDATLLAIAANQASSTGGVIAGQAIMVPVAEAAPGVTRVGRFGWKGQQASLLSFSADAYLNEMGITSALQMTENSSNGSSIADYDPTPEPEDHDDDIRQFASFMRSTMAPPRDAGIAATADAQRGRQVFSDIGCNICHVTSLTTLPAGTPINGGKFVIPQALGSKTFHPFGDFLLHDIGTGDGIVQNGGQRTANKMRTAPLWGVRTHDRFLHDGRAVSIRDAILYHGGEAQGTRSAFKNLSADDRNALLTFLSSL
jgi:CxxC motif-containing protein (DUF1111 family)